jgi:hypothetical protein
MQLTQNFEFLAEHDAELVKLGELAERFFRDDPSCWFRYICRVLDYRGKK